MDPLNTYTHTQTPNVGASPTDTGPRALPILQVELPSCPSSKKKQNKEKHVLVHDWERICLDTDANIIVMHFLLTMMPCLPLFSLYIG